MTSPDSGEVFAAHDPGDLIAAVAHQLGAEPSDCLIVVAVDDDGTVRSLAQAPLPRTAADAARIATDAAGHASGGLVLLAYTDTGHDGLRTLDQLAWLLRGQDVDVLDVVTIGPHSWWSRQHPPAGHEPDAGVPHRPASGQFPNQADPPSPLTRADLAALFDPDPASCAALLPHLHAKVVNLEPPGLGDLPGPATLQLCRRVRFLLDHLAGTGEDPVPSQAAELALAAAIPPARDMCWALMTARTAEAHAGVWATVTRSVTGRLRAGPAGLAGFALWLNRQPGAAYAAAEVADAADPGQPLTLLVRGLLRQGRDPDSWRLPERARLLDVAGPSPGCPL